jgi:hypothetical protein
MSESFLQQIASLFSVVVYLFVNDTIDNKNTAEERGITGRKTSLLVVVFELACCLLILMNLATSKRLLIVVGEEHLLLASVPPAQHYIPTSHSAMHITLSMLLRLIVMRPCFVLIRVKSPSVTSQNLLEYRRQIRALVAHVQSASRKRRREPLRLITESRDQNKVHLIIEFISK